MDCPLCKGKMVKGKTNLPYELSPEKIVVINRVPAHVCQQCGDAFIEAGVARQVEKLVATAKKDGMTMGFVSFSHAA